MASVQQYVTLVVQGGTPVRLANQVGAPYPTTGQGALVFSSGGNLSNPTIDGNLTVNGDLVLGSSTDNFGIFYGSGAPTFAAAANSLYMRSDGNSTTTRMYVNTTGSTTWATVITSA